MNKPATDDQPIVGGVDTHKEQHVAAVVDAHDRVLGSAFFPATRHGYKQMVRWMRMFGDLQRLGVESTGSYGAGLLRYLQRTGLIVLEVTTPDKTDRRKRGKDDRVLPRSFGRFKEGSHLSQRSVHVEAKKVQRRVQALY